MSKMGLRTHHLQARYRVLSSCNPIKFNLYAISPETILCIENIWKNVGIGHEKRNFLIYRIIWIWKPLFFIKHAISGASPNIRPTHLVFICMQIFSPATANQCSHSSSDSQLQFYFQLSISLFLLFFRRFLFYFIFIFGTGMRF